MDGDWDLLIATQCHQTVAYILVNIGSDNALGPNGTKPLLDRI